MLRKELRKTDKENANYKRLKWILYKQYYALSDQQLDDLDAAFIDSPVLEKIYHIRENFHHILDNTDTAENAIKAVNNWVEELTKKEITLFDGFVKTLKNTQLIMSKTISQMP